MPTSVVPIFRIFDYNKAVEFYVDWLGFSIDWEHKFDEESPLYIQVSRNGIVLHLSEHHGDTTPWSRPKLPLTTSEVTIRKFETRSTNSIIPVWKWLHGMLHALRS